MDTTYKHTNAIARIIIRKGIKKKKILCKQHRLTTKNNFYFAGCAKTGTQNHK